MHASRTDRLARRYYGTERPTDRILQTVAKTRLSCPYCFWFLLGICLLVCMPGLGSVKTPVGALWLWLGLLPLGSAALRRVLIR